MQADQIGKITGMSTITKHRLIPLRIAISAPRCSARHWDWRWPRPRWPRTPLRFASATRRDGNAIAGLKNCRTGQDLPYKIECGFPAWAPILEALNAGALDVGYTGDLSFLTVCAAGAPIKAIGGTRSDARTRRFWFGRIHRSRTPRI